jgi:hypothetical protein
LIIVILDEFGCGSAGEAAHAGRGHQAGTRKITQSDGPDNPRAAPPPAKRFGSGVPSLRSGERTRNLRDTVRRRTLERAAQQLAAAGD